MAVKFKKGTLDLTNITRGRNVRLLSRERDPDRIRDLADDIRVNGLSTPLIVSPGDGDTFNLVQGFRRFAALTTLATTEPVVFKGLFPNDIPVQIAEGTPQEIAILHVDQAQVQSLSKVELQIAANFLFDANLPDDIVAVRLAGLLDEYHPPTKKKAEELSLIRQKALSEFSTAPNRDELAEKAYNDAYATFRKGVIQNMRNLWRLPAIAMGGFIWQAADRTAEDLPAGVTVEQAEAAPTLNTVRWNALWQALQADMKTKAGTGKQNPGPKFWEKWREFVAADQKAATDAAARPKAMAGKDIEAMRGNFRSIGFQALLMQIRGTPDAEVNLVEEDAMLAAVEAISNSVEEADMALIDEVMQRGTSLIEARNAAAAGEQSETESTETANA